MREYVGMAMLKTALQIINKIAYYRHLVQVANKLLERESIVALVLIGDRHIGWETAFVKAANLRNIPSLILTISWSIPQGDARYRLMRPKIARERVIRTLPSRIVGKLFPGWVYTYEGKRLFFQPLDFSLSAWITGIMPRNPWAIGGGNATRMAVEGPFSYRLFRTQGIPEEKIVVTGRPGVDQVHEAMASAYQYTIREELEIPESGRVLLCSLPQLGEANILSWEQHWQEIELLLATFARLKDVSVVLSLHPKCNPADYQSLAERYCAILAKQRIYELLPVCDVFVSTLSSTVVQAIAIARPTVVVDFYGLGYHIYDDAPGVIIVRELEHLESTLARLFSDSQYYSQLADDQRQQTGEWTLLDGKCTERVVEELYKLIENPAQRSHLIGS